MQKIELVLTDHPADKGLRRYYRISFFTASVLTDHPADKGLRLELVDDVRNCLMS